jgi:hypothetical protein
MHNASMSTRSYTGRCLYKWIKHIFQTFSFLFCKHYCLHIHLLQIQIYYFTPNHTTHNPPLNCFTCTSLNIHHTIIVIWQRNVWLFSNDLTSLLQLKRSHSIQSYTKMMLNGQQVDLKAYIVTDFQVLPHQSCGDCEKPLIDHLRSHPSYVAATAFSTPNTLRQLHSITCWEHVIWNITFSQRTHTWTKRNACPQVYGSININKNIFFSITFSFSYIARCLLALNSVICLRTSDSSVSLLSVLYKIHGQFWLLQSGVTAYAPCNVMVWCSLLVKTIKWPQQTNKLWPPKYLRRADQNSCATAQ